jgi:hypothetical protein
VKDIFDTAGLPTEYGSPIYRGHRPRTDPPVRGAASPRGVPHPREEHHHRVREQPSPPTRNPHCGAYFSGAAAKASRFCRLAKQQVAPFHS